MSLEGRPGNDDPGHLLMGWEEMGPSLYLVYRTFCFVLFTIMREGGEQRDKREKGRAGEGRREGRKRRGEVGWAEGQNKAIKSANTPKLKSGVLFHISCRRKEVTRCPSMTKPVWLNG